MPTQLELPSAIGASASASEPAPFPSAQLASSSAICHLTSAISESSPEVSAEQLAAVLHVLADGAWWTAAGLADRLGTSTLFSGKARDTLIRHLRAVANTSAQIASAPGSPGYKLTRLLTEPELEAVYGKTVHQSEEMRARALRIKNAWLLAHQS